MPGPPEPVLVNLTYRSATSGDDQLASYFLRESNDTFYHADHRTGLSDLAQVHRTDTTHDEVLFQTTNAEYA